jgi:exodeoxyribonuclease VII small subunit
MPVRGEEMEEKKNADCTPGGNAPAGHKMPLSQGQLQHITVGPMSPARSHDATGRVACEGPQHTGSMPTPSPSRAARNVSSSSAPATYEAALEELEQLVAQLDAGQLPLDQLLTRYQRGAELLAFCRARLEDVENQIKVLEGGSLKPWDAA